MTEILKSVIADGKGIEVNTSSYRYHLPDSTPSREILRLYRALGGEIVTIGSDSRRPGQLGAHIETAKAMLKAMDSRWFCTYDGMVPTFHSL